MEGNRKIRVRLTGDDLINMNINVAMLTPDSPELHRFLLCIMDRIKRETGFEADGGRLMVEAAPSDGGVTLTVTRLDILPAAKAPRLRVKQKKSRDEVYRFAGFDAMCAYLCAADEAVLGDMRIYTLDSEFYAVSAADDRRLLEFTQRLITASESFLIEHADTVAARGGVPKMAEGLRNLKN